MKLRERDQAVLDVLREAYPEWLGPTRIGQALGYRHEVASSRVMPCLRRLIAAGMVERNTWRGEYRYVPERVRGGER